MIKNKLSQLRSNPLARNTFWMFAGQACSMSLKAGYFLVIARFLGPQQYGAFVGVSALVSILAPYATVGSGNLLIKNVSRDRSLFNIYWGNALVISITSGLGLMVVLLLVANIVFPMRFPITLLAMVALSDLLFARIVDVSAQAFQAVEILSRTATLTSIINAARFVGAILVVVFVQHPTAVTWSFVYLASTTIAASIGVFSIHRKFGRPSTQLSRVPGEMAEGCFFAGSQSAQNIYNDIDKTMLARLSTLEYTGIYAAAYRLIDVAFVPVRALLFAAYAGFFRHGADGIGATRRYSRGLLYRAMAYGALVSVALFLFAPVIPMLIGHQYALTANALRWLSPLPFIKSIHYFEADTLTGSGHQGLRTSIQGFVALLNFGLNCWLIPLYSWKGAAWTSLASDSSLAILLIIASAYLARRETFGDKIPACPEEVEHAI